jgi:hypothetical protein
MYVCVTMSSGVLEYITIVPINYRVFLIRFLSRVITMYFINKKHDGILIVYYSTKKISWRRCCDR